MRHIRMGAGGTAARALGLAVLVAAGAGPAAGDTVVLRDGRALEGEVSEEGDVLVLQQRYATIRVPRSEVDSVRLDERAPTDPGTTPETRPEEPVPGAGSGTKADDTPAAGMLASAARLRSSRRHEEAVGVLELLLSLYPASREAGLARERLAQYRADYLQSLGLIEVDGEWLTPEQVKEREGKVRYLGTWHDRAGHERWLANNTYYEGQVREKNFEIWTNVPNAEDRWLAWLAFKTGQVYEAYEDIYGVKDREDPGVIQVGIPESRGDTTLPRRETVKAERDHVRIYVARDYVSYLRMGGPPGGLGVTHTLRDHDFVLHTYLQDSTERWSVMAVYIHEMGHVFFNRVLKYGPRWIDEGLAHYFALGHFMDMGYGRNEFKDDDCVRTVETLLRAGGYDTIGDLLRKETYALGFGGHQYAESWVFVSLLMDRYPREFRRYVRALRTDRTTAFYDYFPEDLRLEDQRLEQFDAMRLATYRQTLADHPINPAVTREALQGIRLLYRFPLTNWTAARFMQDVLMDTQLANVSDAEVRQEVLKARHKTLLGLFGRAEADRIEFDFDDTRSSTKGPIAAADAWRRLAMAYEEKGWTDRALQEYRAMERAYLALDVIDAVEYARQRVQMVECGLRGLPFDPRLVRHAPRIVAMLGPELARFPHPASLVDRALSLAEGLEGR
ncbi:MAG: hypothetical protein HY722_08510 [Planctomycetes bacterium]|nr:hypothetical protein [Planctomycetota bacterium]